MVLFDHAKKREWDNYKFQAAMHGVDLEEGVMKSGGKKEAPKNEFVFGSPEDYAHLTKEEREELTKKMMGQHKSWASKTPLGRK